ncbi:MAG: nucleotide-binding universal stress UspA family protein [Gammaproteobacteria bacterium]|jgi:nucleotide-binding universal stress UspA family protein
MKIKDVLVYLDNDTACETRVLSAANLCVQFDAHLAGLYLMRKTAIPTYPGAPMSVGVYDILDEYSLEQSQSAQLVFSEQTNAAGISAEYREIEGDVTQMLNVHSRYTDLAVIPLQQEKDSNLNTYYLPTSFLLGSACPVLALPDIKPITRAPQSVLVAWDGSREAARALKAALPLLHYAEKVDVVSIASNDAEAMDITHHISRHGIEAETHLIKGSASDAGQLLLEQTLLLGSQLLVMGAYGHSRLREQILGGATKYVMQHAQLPVLFSH